MSYVGIVYIISCCLISRDEEGGALRPADADKNLLLTRKTGSLQRNVLLVMHKLISLQCT